MLTFSVIGEKLIFGFRNHAKIWVSGKLGYESPRDFKIDANYAKWPLSILGYMLIHTLYINMAILHSLHSFKNL